MSRAREIRRDEEKRRQRRMKRWFRASVAALLVMALVATAIIGKFQRDRARQRAEEPGWPDADVHRRANAKRRPGRR